MANNYIANKLSHIQESKIILKDVNLNLCNNKVYCLLGNNGSGKSTLLKILSGILKPTLGKIFLNQHDIFKLNDLHRASMIGWLPQNLNRPYHMTLSEFLKIRQKKHKIIEHTHDVFEINQLLTKPISSLSGGEWKRAQLASLWKSEFKILFLDEPDSDLDMRHKKNLVYLCKEYVQENNSIILVATHDINFARDVSDAVLALVEGKMIWNSNADYFWQSPVINKIFSTKVL